MKTKFAFQGFKPLILMITLLVLLTNCKKHEDVTANSDQLTGKWSGTLTANDPAIGHPENYTLSIDFDRLTGKSAACGNGQITGIVKIVSSSVIEVDWPMCGYEKVTYSFSNGTLTASGSIQAYSDNRIYPTEWNLTK